MVRQDDNKILYSLPSTLLRGIPFHKSEDESSSIVGILFEHRKDEVLTTKQVKLYFASGKKHQTWRCYLALENLAEELRQHIEALKAGVKKLPLPPPKGSYVYEDASKTSAVLLAPNYMPPQKIDLEKLLQLEALPNANDSPPKTARYHSEDASTRAPEFEAQVSQEVPKAEMYRTRSESDITADAPLVDLSFISENEEAFWPRSNSPPTLSNSTSQNSIQPGVIQRSPTADPFYS